MRLAYVKEIFTTNPWVAPNLTICMLVYSQYRLENIQNVIFQPKPMKKVCMGLGLPNSEISVYCMDYQGQNLNCVNKCNMGASC